MIKARIEIRLKKGVVDPEGKNILKALNLLGFKNVKDVKTSRVVYIFIDGMGEEDALREVEEMCKKLLVNPVVNEYSIKIEDLHD
ncbi:MAG: phosphoribosylformylglycinamidine synthase subunit PurS [Thermoplasmatales archaeon]|nr:phosphoribosylformylglycinamidine synthase subunit PurS [Thermoplasmatales archaeon]